jgi:hypothetical protein
MAFPRTAAWTAAAACAALLTLGCSGGKGSGVTTDVDGGVGTSSTHTTRQAPGTTGGTTGGAVQGNQQQQPGGPSSTTPMTSQGYGG